VRVWSSPRILFRISYWISVGANNYLTKFSRVPAPRHFVKRARNLVGGKYWRVAAARAESVQRYGAIAVVA